MRCPLCESDSYKMLNFETAKVYVCLNCNLQYIDEQQNKEYYKGFHKKFCIENVGPNKLREKQYDIHAKFIEEIISQGRILDVGCSNGDLISRLKNNKNYQLFGIDPDSSAISTAKEKYGNDIQFDDCDLISYKTEKKFDAVIFRGTLQYLGFDLRKTLEKLLTILTENGIIIILSLPNSDSLIYYLLKDKWDLFRKLEHTLIFNRNSMIWLANHFGLEITHFSYPYLETPYADIENDYKKLIELIKNNQVESIPFWGNMMQIILKKSKS